MAWRFDGRVLVVVHGFSAPTNLEWHGLLTEALEPGHPEGDMRILIVSYGGVPDSDQRRRLERMFGATPPRAAVMTNSSLGRALVGALSFFNRNMSATSLQDFEKACAHLELTASERQRARRTRDELEGKVQLNRNQVTPPASHR